VKAAQKWAAFFILTKERFVALNAIDQQGFRGSSGLLFYERRQSEEPTATHRREITNADPREVN
jgi:hypothetical protein